jgi:hypothetical protein
LTSTEPRRSRAATMKLPKERKYSATYVNHMRRLVQRVLAVAIRVEEWRGLNPAERVRRRREPKRKPSFLEAHEVVVTLLEIKPFWRPQTTKVRPKRRTETTKTLERMDWSGKPESNRRPSAWEAARRRGPSLNDRPETGGFGQINSIRITSRGVRGKADFCTCTRARDNRTPSRRFKSGAGFEPATFGL